MVGRVVLIRFLGGPIPLQLARPVGFCPKEGRESVQQVSSRPFRQVLLPVIHHVVLSQHLSRTASELSQRLDHLKLIWEDEYKMITIRLVSVTAGPSCVVVCFTVVVDCHRKLLFTVVLALAMEREVTREDNWRRRPIMSILAGEVTWFKIKTMNAVT